MSELAPAFTHASELLTARDIATLLKITPKAVRLRMANVAPVMRDNLQTWAFGSLPIDYQEELIFVRKRAGAWTIAEAIQFATPKWEPKKPFAKLPAASQEKAYKVKDVLTAYYAVIEKDGTEREARCAARSKWLEVFFPRGCSERTIINWVAKIEARGGLDHARIEAYADEKSCAHINQRSQNRKKNPTPGELIMEFKRRCALPDMNMAAAHRSLAQDWRDGRDVPGLEINTDPAAPFPFKLAQLRKFAPATSTRMLGNKGKATAQRDALHYIVRTYAHLRPCEMYVFDDTRVNIAVLLDDGGKRVEVKCYVAMELASRKIVGYVLREGNMRAHDVDELVAQTLRHSGLAHERAGYVTTLLFERGILACSPDRERFLRAMKPDQLVIKRTSMDGGRNFPGDYVQKASGHWMGKGAIESFMKTLGLLLRDVPGQIGSTYRETPAVMGDPNKPHAGGIVDESLKLVEAARVASVLQNMGQEAASAIDAVKALGVRPALLFFSELRQRFAKAIDAYNEMQGHRREGFDLIAVDNASGGRDHVAESSNQRWHKLVWREKQRGTEPECLCAANTAMLLNHRARPVTVTQQGVRIAVGNRPYLFWHPASEACAEADQVTGSKKKFTALVNEDDLSEIFILRADTGQFVESLPRYEKPGANDPVAMRHAYAESRQTHERARTELRNIMGGQVRQHIEKLDEETEKMRAVVSTTVGSPDADGTVSYFLKDTKFRAKRTEPPSPYAASLSKQLKQMEEEACS